jgi:hypothetical protein
MRGFMFLFQSNSALQLSKNADAIRKRMLDMISDLPAEFKGYERHAEVMGINFFSYQSRYRDINIPSNGPDLNVQQQDAIILKMFQALDAEWQRNVAARQGRPGRTG